MKQKVELRRLCIVEQLKSYIQKVWGTISLFRLLAQLPNTNRMMITEGVMQHSGKHAPIQFCMVMLKITKTHLVF